MKTKQLANHGARRKEGTYSRNDSSKSDLAELPDAARSSAPQKVITLTVSQKRDVLALVEVAAATAIPMKVTEESEELFAESAQALYNDFRAADPIDSIIARVMCGISSMTMDALGRGRRSQTLEQREMELKSATRGALVLAELSKAYDGRRARVKQTVNVGQVKIEAGGQAVVGNVTSESSEVPQAQEMLPPQPKVEDSIPSS